LQVEPQIKWCVTTRHALGLRAEQVQELRPLSTAEARRFFVERAQSRKPSFGVTPNNTADINEVCRRLEGVLLALELAASCITTFAPRELLRRLDQQFRILKTNAPDLPPRQRALRGAIDWSYELLTEPAKMLLARLAVFARGFTLTDADAVCSEENMMGAEFPGEEAVTVESGLKKLDYSEGQDELDVLVSIQDLRGQSLLSGEVDSETQETHFVMLGSVRAYALEKLHLIPANELMVRQRHAVYFLQYAQEWLAHLRGLEEATALRQLDMQTENISATLEWTHRNQQYQLCGELALVLGTFWQRRGLTKESLRCFDIGLEAVQHIDAEPNASQSQRPPQVQLHQSLSQLQLTANLWRERGGSYHNWLDIEKMRQCAQEALIRFEQLGDHKGQGEALNLLGLAAKREGDFPAARRYFTLALEHHPLAHEEVLVAVEHNNLGITECEDPAGDKQAAANHLQEALRLRRDHGDQRGIAETLNNLGVLHWELSDLEAAWNSYAEALPYEKALRNSVEIGRVLYNMSEIAEKKEDWPLASRLATAADVLFEQMDSPFKRYSTALCARVTLQAAGAGETLVTNRERLKDSLGRSD